MSDNTLTILFVFMILLVILAFVGCGFDLAGDALAHQECLEQGIPTDASYTYMRGLRTNDAICVVKAEVPIQVSE